MFTDGSLEHIFHACLRLDDFRPDDYAILSALTGPKAEDVSIEDLVFNPDLGLMGAQIYKMQGHYFTV